MAASVAHASNVRVVQFRFFRVIVFTIRSRPKRRPVERPLGPAAPDRDDWRFFSLFLRIFDAPPPWRRRGEMRYDAAMALRKENRCAVPCSFTPDETALSEPGVHHDAARGRLVFDLPLPDATIDRLRRYHAEQSEWRRALDRVVEAQQLVHLTRVSAYPATRWSLLLGGLGSGEERPWREFMDRYRTPIERSLHKLTRSRGLDHLHADDLVGEFFAWFFAKGQHHRLRRTDDAGNVHRFRGYLKFVLRQFLHDAVLPRRSMERIDTSTAEDLAVSDADVGEAIDLELCRQIVSSTLEVMRRDAHSMWRALLDDLSGLKLREVAQRLVDDPDSDGASVAKAHRMRTKAREMFRSRLLQYEIERGCVISEQASDEFAELLDLVAIALAEYRDTHREP